MGQGREGLARLRSIGALARASGLSVSALRFYDAAGVLRPAEVDAASGYRWYTAEQVTTARLIASLRRVSMPLDNIGAVLAVRHVPEEAEGLLDQHLHRLEAGLLDARRQLDLARSLITPTPEENPMTTLAFRTTDLAAAFAAVRYAISTDPEQQALNGVLLDFDGTTLRLVATDRFRLAVAVVAVAAGETTGPACRVVAPAALLGDSALLQEDPARTDATVRIELTEHTVTIGDQTADAIDAAFPDYQQLLRTAPAESVRVRAANLVELVTAGPTRTLVQNPDNAPHEVSAVVVNRDTIEITADHPDAVGFNREFLLQALDATGAEELVLALDGPIRPLAIWAPERPDDVSLLMPTRLG